MNSPCFQSSELFDSFCKSILNVCFSSEKIQLFLENIPSCEHLHESFFLLKQQSCLCCIVEEFVIRNYVNEILIVFRVLIVHEDPVTCSCRSMTFHLYLHTNTLFSQLTDWNHTDKIVFDLSRTQSYWGIHTPAAIPTHKYLKSTFF